MFEENMGKFGRISIGVHGKELPKFSEEESENKLWWKKQKDYVESPVNASSKILRMGQKTWAKRDERLVAESLNLETPADSFKTLHVSKTNKN